MQYFTQDMAIYKIHPSKRNPLNDLCSSTNVGQILLPIQTVCIYTHTHDAMHHTKVLESRNSIRCVVCTQTIVGALTMDHLLDRIWMYSPVASYEF